MIKLPKFRLVTMLLVMALLAMGLGWWQDWYRRQSPLYLHVLMAKTYTGEKTNPPKCVATILIRSHGEFDVQFNERHLALTGNVTRSLTGAYELDVQGNFASSFMYSGPVELETITAPTGFIISGALYPYSFALSRNKDSQLLLDKSTKSLSEKQALWEM